jgi:hypothetical protein
MPEIVFVQNITYEYLGVMYISALLKKHGHQVEVFLNMDRVKKIIGRGCGVCTRHDRFPMHDGRSPLVAEIRRNARRALSIP